MDTSPIDSDKTTQTDIPSDEAIEVIEISLSSPEPTEPAPNHPSLNAVKSEPEGSTSLLLSKLYRRGGFSFSSSGSDKSVGAYFTRKLEALESFKKAEITSGSAGPDKQSESQGCTVFPISESAVSLQDNIQSSSTHKVQEGNTRYSPFQISSGQLC